MADHIVAALTAERHRKKISQREILADYGGSQGRLSRQETGDLGMTTAQAAQYAGLLGMRFVLVPVESVEIPDSVLIDAARDFVAALGGMGRVAGQAGEQS